jgi:ubiquinone/menaquinone biosynthesis C-methylase UbiE
MRRALKSGCHGLAIDHSPDMVANAARLNRHAVSSGRLTVLPGDAASLPAGDGGFDKAYCLNAFFFFPDPQASIAEMARVLKPGGQIALVTSPPEFRAQIARFSKTMAESMRFDMLETLDRWMREAGLVVEEMTVAPNAGNLVIARKASAA